ncbi:hypothetical protein V1478_003587 [Vespula squamosa]|uniref:Uncharacterized protein n=1 Tax=Vespula squamosa TaxID=30214 RepID=A0ABD2BMS0_VESSQ
MEGEKRIRKRYDDAAGLAVADFKTPLSKEVRSTSVIVNVGSSVGQAFHDRRRTKDHEEDEKEKKEVEEEEKEEEEEDVKEGWRVKGGDSQGDKTFEYSRKVSLELTPASCPTEFEFNE